MGFQFRTCCAEIILNVARYFEHEKKTKKTLVGANKARARAVAATGVSRTSLYDLLRGECELLEPGDPEVRESVCQIEDEDVAKIRPVVVELVLAKQPVTLDRILAKLKEDPVGWAWSRSTLYRAMLRLGFSFSRRKHGYYERLREDEENMVRRAHYLEFFFKYEAAGRPFIYLDESWLNQGLDRRDKRV